MLTPPLEPARRQLLGKKAALLVEATSVDNCVAPMGEFLTAVDAALAAAPAARPYGRAVFNAWRHVCAIHEELSFWDRKKDREYYGSDGEDGFVPTTDGPAPPGAVTRP
jgi:hypothetical protein